ncbi:MAG: hypothetical protein IPJ84_09625 [Bdellovibrionales bacterium]|nr:hypothetical protein [Bdellovibrionales bacterium]
MSSSSAWCDVAGAIGNAGAAGCVDNIRRIFSSDSGSRVGFDVSKTELALKHSLTAKQRALSEVAAKKESKDIYTAAELAEENRRLVKSGFTEEDISKLRKEGILTNSVLSMQNGAPKGIEILSANYDELASANLKNLGSKNVNYIMGENGSLYVSREPLKLPQDKLVVLMNNAKNGESVLVREAGVLEVAPAGTAFKFKPSYGFQSSSAETREMVESVSAMSPGVRVSYQASAAIPHGRVVNCLDIMSAQSKGKNFVLDRVIGENLVTTTAIAAGEFAGAGRLDTATGQHVVMADMIGTNVNSVIGAAVGKHLVLGTQTS